MGMLARIGFSRAAAKPVAPKAPRSIIQHPFFKIAFLTFLVLDIGPIFTSIFDSRLDTDDVKVGNACGEDGSVAAKVFMLKIDRADDSTNFTLRDGLANTAECLANGKACEALNPGREIEIDGKKVSGSNLFPVVVKRKYFLPATISVDDDQGNLGYIELPPWQEKGDCDAK
ncbi:MAG: hypothetical protein HQ564_05055 [Candidatus Saganbacteria bacterium]|nr:hypothetical protein [Candidatus Saganbacteria bacterium]